MSDQMIEKRKKIEEEFKKLQDSRVKGVQQIQELQRQIGLIDKRSSELQGSYTTLTELIGDDPTKKKLVEEKKEELKEESPKAEKSKK